jgi:hypothetical protein
MLHRAAPYGVGSARRGGRMAEDCARASYNLSPACGGQPRVPQERANGCRTPPLALLQPAFVVKLLYATNRCAVRSGRKGNRLRNAKDRHGKKEQEMEYLVIGSEGPGFATKEEALQMLESLVLPSFERLQQWEAEGKIRAGGLPVADRSFVFIAEAASNDALDSMLRSLPLWGALKWEVKPLQSFEARAKLETAVVNQLKR